MPIRHGGRLASRASTWPRDHFCCSTMAPRRFWPTMWNEFLPISMPITAGAGEVSSFCDMACSLSSVPPASITRWQGGSTAGPSHYRKFRLLEEARCEGGLHKAGYDRVDANAPLSDVPGESLRHALQGMLTCRVHGASRAPDESHGGRDV